VVEGRVAFAKLGPIVQSDRGEQHPLYIIGPDAWPAECFGSDGKPRRVRVTGTVVKRTDIPAYKELFDWSHDPTDPKTWRFLLKDATWTVLD
jgi:hypothetical protein